MQYITLALTTLAAVATASPVERRQADTLCPGLNGTPVCCNTSVLDVLNLSCDPPSGNPQTPDEFVSACSGIGLTANCCAVPLAGDGLLCTTVT